MLIIWDTTKTLGDTPNCGGYTINKSFTFPISFSNANYGLIGPGFWVTGVAGCFVGTKTASGFITGSNSGSSGVIGWIAIGY